MPLILKKPIVGQEYTAEELLDLPPEWRFELIDGKLREMRLPGNAAHGAVTALFIVSVMPFIQAKDAGDGFATGTGFLLRRNPDTVKAPDFAFVSHERLQDVARGASYLAAVPDLVLETRSPSDRAAGIQSKIHEWLTAGVRLVLDLDPEKKRMVVYQPETEPMTLEIDDTFDGGTVLPGFTLPLRRLFPRG